MSQIHPYLLDRSLDVLLEGVAIYDRLFRCVYLNAKAAKILGGSKKDQEGAVHEALRIQLNSTFESSKYESGIITQLRGTDAVYEGSFAPIPGENGKCQYVIVVLRCVADSSVKAA